MTIIDCLSDLHGNFPQLEGGDLLIVAGDLVRTGDSENEFALFDYWLNDQKYKTKIVIAGNHDNVLAEGRIKFQFCDYLCDSGTEFEYDKLIEDHWTTQTLKIWGSPWTKKFEGMNPKCMAFTVDTEEELAEKFSKIPEDVDILITHSPAYGILDTVKEGKNHRINVGSKSLLNRLIKIDPTIHVVGHIHEDYGWIYQPAWADRKERWRINASHVNENYEPVNKPIRIEL